MILWHAISSAFRLLKQSAIAWSEDGCPRLGAALSFYTVFSLSPVLVIVITIASFVFGQQAVTGHLVAQINGLVGADGAKTVQSLIENAYMSDSKGAATGLSFITLLLGASAVFNELQEAMNIVWNVGRTQGHALNHFIKHRLLSFTLVVAMGFLLLASLIVSAVLAAITNYISDNLIGAGILLQWINIIVSLAVITSLFALIFKVVPDTDVQWKDVWLGAFITAVLFTVGKQLIGLYLGRSAVMSTYGAAGSLAVVMLWVYYSAQIMLFGAEFTYAYSHLERKSHKTSSTPSHQHSQPSIKPS